MEEVGPSAWSRGFRFRVPLALRLPIPAALEGAPLQPSLKTSPSPPEPWRTRFRARELWELDGPLMDQGVPRLPRGVELVVEASRVPKPVVKMMTQKRTKVPLMGQVVPRPAELEASRVPKLTMKKKTQTKMTRKHSRT